MTEYFMILINVKSILKLCIILESPFKDNITTNKDNISNLSKFLYINDTCLKIDLFILAAGRNNHTI